MLQVAMFGSAGAVSENWTRPNLSKDLLLSKSDLMTHYNTSLYSFLRLLFIYLWYNNLLGGSVTRSIFILCVKIDMHNNFLWGYVSFLFIWGADDTVPHMCYENTDLICSYIIFTRKRLVSKYDLLFYASLHIFYSFWQPTSHMGVSLSIATHTFCTISPAEHQKSQPLLHTRICQERSAGNQQKHKEKQQKSTKSKEPCLRQGLGGASRPPICGFWFSFLIFFVFLLISCRSFLAYTGV